ncbi:MAG TPA: hypothetical protein ENJ67_04880, partial [Sulfurimonas autotrophica]|nr:hypothetical protein [Sulfurimonas autotrophica]
AKIEAKDVTLVSREGSITNQRYAKSVSYGYGGNKDDKTLIGDAAAITAKNSLDIQAANSFTNKGSKLAAKELNIEANDVQITTTKDTKDLFGGDSDNYIKEQSTTHLASNIDADNINISSRKTTTIQGSNVNATESLNIKAKKIDVLAVNNTNYSETHSSSSGFLSSKEETNIKLSQKTQSSKLTADNIRLKSTDDTNLEASQITAKKTLDLQSEQGDVNLLAKSYTNAALHESKKSSFGGLKTTHSIDALSQTKLAGSAASAKNSITVGGKDVNVIASNLESQEGTLTLDAKNNINISAANESSSEQHFEEKKNFSLALSGSKLTYTTITKDTNTHTTTTNKASNLSAKNITLKSAADTNIIASDLKAESINVDAKKDFNLLAAKNTTHTTREHSKKDLGVEVTLNSKEASAFTGYWEEANGQSTTKKDVAKSTLDTGTLNLKTTNVNIVGSDILTNNAQIDSKNIKLLATTASTDTQRYTKSIKTGVKVGVTQNISNAIDTMKNIGDAKNGTGTAARTLKAYDAINSFLQKPVDAGVYAVYNESRTGTTTHSEQVVASNLYANNNAALHAQEKIEVGGSNIYAGNNLDIQAKDINLHATAANYSSATASSSKNAKASLYGSDMGTLTLAFQNSSNKIEGTTNSHTYITALGKVTLTSTQDTTLKGAVVDANDLELNVGRNLVMQSLQDTQTIRGKSKEGSVSINVLTAAPQGASANYGTSKGDKAWINEVTSLNAQNSMRVRVSDTTTLKGASITNKDASGVDRGNLQLATKKLVTEDIQDHDNYKSSNVGVGVGSIDSNPSLNSIEFAKRTQDKEQIVRATIGKGRITNFSDTSHINRDIAKTKQLTKDESSDIELYASDTSLHALANPTQTYKDIKQKAKDVGLASHKGIVEDLPSASKGNDGKGDFIDNTIGTLVDASGEWAFGIIPTVKNDGGYITQIATQVFGDSRNIIVAKDAIQFEKWKLKPKDPEHPNKDWDYESYTTPEGKIQ